MIEARDTGAAQAPAGRGRDFWPEGEGKGKSSRRLPPPKVLFGAAGALVVIIAVAVAAVVLTGGEEKKAPPVAQVLPLSYVPTYTSEGLAKLAQRSADPRPVGEGEMFGADTKSVSAGKFTFDLAGTSVSADCKAVTWGQRLQADLAAHGCSQILRGAYVSKDKRHLGQFIVINLKDVEGVRQILRVLDTKAGFVLPLNPKGAPAFGPGFSAAYAKTFGHYAVVSWVQRAGGGQPASLNEVIEASLPIEKPVDFVWARADMAAGK